jgi:L-arabinokinase
METFPKQKDIPLLASPGRACREKIQNSKRKARNNLGNSKFKNSTSVSNLEISASDFLPDTGRQWVLLSFTSLDLDLQALEQIRKLSDDYEFFCVDPLDYPGSCIHSIDRHQISFADIMASCDIVISKPGFGLVSECIVNNKPLIYADRGNFAEYPYLVEGIEKYLKNVYLPSELLYAGKLRSSLKAIQKAPSPTGFIKRSGAETIAEEILKQSRPIK